MRAIPLHLRHTEIRSSCLWKYEWKQAVRGRKAAVRSRRARQLRRRAANESAKSMLFPRLQRCLHFLQSPLHTISTFFLNHGKVLLIDRLSNTFTPPTMASAPDDVGEHIHIFSFASSTVQAMNETLALPLAPAIFAHFLLRPERPPSSWCLHPPCRTIVQHRPSTAHSALPPLFSS